MRHRLTPPLLIAASTLSLALVAPSASAHPNSPAADARSGATRPAESQTINVNVTSYGYNDNDDGNGHYGTAQIAYPQIHSEATEDLGTYDRPVTFATDPGEFAPGTRIYVPFLQKYFIMEDGCAECSSDWQNGVYHVDLWMGPASSQPEPALDDCEGSITQSADIVVNPEPGLPVDTTAMFSDGQCTAVHH
jgi:3D (Asp-Asp-Asp) domain-containing protein